MPGIAARPLTLARIQACLERAIALHPGCRGFQVVVQVRRLERELAPPGAWGADFHAIGEPRDRWACENALLEILASAREDYWLSLDS